MVMEMYRCPVCGFVTYTFLSLEDHKTKECICGHDMEHHVISTNDDAE